MNKIRYYIAKCSSKIFRNHQLLINYYKRRGAKVGANCLICTNIDCEDSSLIEIGNNVVISTKVEFVLHDFSISRVIPGKSNLYGKIKIGDNCFLGTRSIILYGVELADNIIVAAGSVVTKSFYQKNIIIGGNPAHVIGTWDSFYDKNIKFATSVNQYVDHVIKNPSMLVKK